MTSRLFNHSETKNPDTSRHLDSLLFRIWFGAITPLLNRLCPYAQFRKMAGHDRGLLLPLPTISGPFHTPVGGAGNGSIQADRFSMEPPVRSQPRFFACDFREVFLSRLLPPGRLLPPKQLPLRAPLPQLPARVQAWFRPVLQQRSGLYPSPWNQAASWDAADLPERFPVLFSFRST